MFDQLGHSSLAVTDRPVRDIAPGEVIAADTEGGADEPSGAELRSRRPDRAQSEIGLASGADRTWKLALASSLLSTSSDHV